MRKHGPQVFLFTRIAQETCKLKEVDLRMCHIAIIMYYREQCRLDVQINLQH